MLSSGLCVLPTSFAMPPTASFSSQSSLSIFPASMSFLVMWARTFCTSLIWIRECLVFSVLHVLLLRYPPAEEPVRIPLGVRLEGVVMGF